MSRGVTGLSLSPSLLGLWELFTYRHGYFTRGSTFYRNEGKLLTFNDEWRGCL